MKRIAALWILLSLSGLVAPIAMVHAGASLASSASDAVAPIDCSTAARPVVAYDTSKGQSPSDLEALLSDLSFKGFSVGTIGADIPACVDILIVQSISGTLGLSSPYTAAEAEDLKRWVDAGHALMVSGEWGTYRADAEAVFAAFGYALGGPDALIDPDDFDSQGGRDRVTFQSDNFAPHAILKGVAEVMFQRSAWLLPSTAAIITSDANARPPGVPVMAAIASGQGCVVLSADGNWLANVTSTRDSPAGYFKHDNALLARQAIGWLNGCGQGPTAWPGGPYTVSLGDDLLLDGSASSDPNGLPLTFAWDLSGDRQFDDALAAQVTFSTAGLHTGVYTPALRVSNGAYTDTAWTRITVIDRPTPATLAHSEAAASAASASAQPDSSLVTAMLSIAFLLASAGLIFVRRRFEKTG